MCVWRQWRITPLPRWYCRAIYSIWLGAAAAWWREARRRAGRGDVSTSATRGEVYAIYQALRLFDARNKSDAAYTVFSDSTAALSRAQTDRAGRGQAFTRATNELAETGGTRELDCTAMDASPRGSGGQRGGGRVCKGGGRVCVGRGRRRCLRGPASPTWPERRPRKGPSARETGSRAMSRAAGVTGSICPGLGKERKEVAGRCCRLLSGHAATGAYLADKVKKI